MKKLISFKSILVICITLLSLKSFAQGDVSELIKSGPADAAKLANAYLNPFFKGLGFGMNSGWYNSAKSKNLGKFDIRIQGSTAFVPESEQTFNFNSLGLSNKTRLRNPNSPNSPTAFGNNTPGPEVVLYDDNNREVSSFNLPNGSGIKFVPSPQIQVTVGLIKNTDVSLRYSPKLNLGDFGSLQVLGFGVKHEITQLLPGKSEKIIPVDIALAFGYNQTTYDYKIAQEDQVNDDPNRQNADLNQRVEGKFSGYTFDAIVSKKLLVFTPFISVGYNTAKTDLGLLGQYIVRTAAPTVTSPLPNSPDKFTTFTDPVKFKQQDIAGIRSSIGFSLHLAFFRLYGAYSIGEYSAVTGGIGLGIGK